MRHAASDGPSGCSLWVLSGLTWCTGVRRSWKQEVSELNHSVHTAGHFLCSLEVTAVTSLTSCPNTTSQIHSTWWSTVHRVSIANSASVLATLAHSKERAECPRAASVSGVHEHHRTETHLKQRLRPCCRLDHGVRAVLDTAHRVCGVRESICRV